MSRPIRGCLLASVGLVFANASGVLWAGMAGQRLVAGKTLLALPAPLRAAFEPHRDGVLERCVEPDGAWRRDAKMRSRSTWHYLMLDAAATDDSSNARMKAAMAFPVDRRLARALFRTHGVTRGGELIWRLDVLVDELSDAMRLGDETTVVQNVGYIIHFCADAADPFHATRDRRGERSGNLVFATRAMGDPLFAHQDVAMRVGWELVRRNLERYGDALDPASVRFELQVDVPQAALECLVEAAENRDRILSADREILDRMQVVDDDAFLARADEYYELLDGACGADVVENLRRAVRLATTLIVTAWTRAGSPENPMGGEVISHVAQKSDQAAQAAQPGSSSPQTKEPQGAKPQTINKPAQNEQGGRFVASKNSKVFHRKSCSHVRRIDEENLESFDSLKEAQDTGRRPCRTCKPNDD